MDTRLVSVLSFVISTLKSRFVPHVNFVHLMFYSKYITYAYTLLSWHATIFFISFFNKCTKLTWDISQKMSLSYFVFQGKIMKYYEDPIPPHFNLHDQPFYIWNQENKACYDCCFIFIHFYILISKIQWPIPVYIMYVHSHKFITIVLVKASWLSIWGCLIQTWILKPMHQTSREGSILTETWIFKFCCESP